MRDITAQQTPWILFKRRFLVLVKRKNLLKTIWNPEVNFLREAMEQTSERLAKLEEEGDRVPNNLIAKSAVRGV